MHKEDWYIHKMEYELNYEKNNVIIHATGMMILKQVCQVKKEISPNTLYGPFFENCPKWQAKKIGFMVSGIVAGNKGGWKRA